MKLKPLIVDKTIKNRVYLNALHSRKNKSIKCNSVCMICLFLLDFCLRVNVFLKYLQAFEYVVVVIRNSAILIYLKNKTKPIRQTWILTNIIYQSREDLIVVSVNTKI